MPIPDGPCGRTGTDGKVCQIIGDHRQHVFTGDSVKAQGTITMAGMATASATAPLSREQQLANWWRQQSENEIEQTVAKAVEYSGTLGGLPADLVDLGRQVAFVQRRERDFTDAELAEIGIWAYIQGKVNRWSSALRNGRMVSSDTLLDIGIYTRIAAKIRETGQWP